MTLNILSIEELEGRVQLSMVNCLFRRCGMSLRPPPGCIIAAKNYKIQKILSGKACHACRYKTIENFLKESNKDFNSEFNQRIGWLPLAIREIEKELK